MRRNGSWMIDARRLGEVVLLSCGGVVDKCVKSFVDTKKSYAHYPQTFTYIVKKLKVFPKLGTGFKQFLHTNFVQSISVFSTFYTQSTMPITTTNYLIKKGI